MKNVSGENKDIEILATWLNGAAYELLGIQGTAQLRAMARRANQQASEMYGEDDELNEPDDIDTRGLLVRFSQALDTDERSRRQDEKNTEE